ncbi:hypothetical protein G6O69_34660 [Pseudenhygromyxa sp. WMMC2535]|uniref:hypothetical protein n=1 Tax=Pseudenhygromyxa sp. WMMC2535 TaxID=2712867 RepID=UPI0015534B30|nr:hypothetical protein [Pseudenhygromyxa sp. WMMC2535]NVB43016.1 hypothetical protein [Pseudenhygromyxa sp. WMMC2535]
MQAQPFQSSHSGVHQNPDFSRQVLIEIATDRVAVAVFGEQPPSDEEWSEYIATLEGLGSGGHRTLVLSVGGGPTALQREQLSALMDGQDDVKVAVLTNSVFARGIVTALRWFRREANAAFEPGKIDAALDYLELDQRERDRVHLVANDLISRLGLEKVFPLAA